MADQVKIPDYGPVRPAEMGNVGYQGFTNKNYLKGYANKILHDLCLMARLYNGHDRADASYSATIWNNRINLS